MATSLCPKCGVANRDTAKYCSGCGAALLSGVPASASPSSPAPAQAQDAGQVLQQRYQIEKELGRGGFGAVYRATDLNLQRVCAVKENLDASQEAQRQFMREATVLANLSHPNLPRVTDHFFIPGKGQYLVMDFVDGADLATLAEQPGKVTVSQAVEWISQVADALVYMHGQSQPVLHRDIKPSNIRITPQGRAMLVDFGLVKFYAPNLKTTIGARAVTPGFAPPEQYGRGTTDARTDIYALGATLYALLTGEQPPESVQRMAGERLTPVSQLNPAVPAHISQAIEKAMALEPRQRFASASEFLAALRAAPVKAAAVTPAASVAPAQVTPVRQPSEPRVAVARQPVAHPAQDVSPAAASRAAPAYVPFPAQSRPTPKKRSALSKILLAGVAIIGLFLCVFAVWFVSEVISGTQQALADTATAEYEETEIVLAQEQTEAAGAPKTATAQARLTRTAAVQETAISAERATQAVRAELTATAQALEEAIKNEWAVFAGSLGVIQQRTLIYGPLSGSLLHEEDGFVEVETASVDITDFVAEVVFSNPYPTTRGAWDYGFLFRYFDDYNQARLVIDSDGTWRLINLSGNESDYKFTDITQGTIYNLDTSTGGSNRLLLICQGNSGWLYINYEFVAAFDLSFRGTAGDVAIGTGINNGHEIAGEATGYTDFTIWSLP